MLAVSDTEIVRGRERKSGKTSDSGSWFDYVADSNVAKREKKMLNGCSPSTSICIQIDREQHKQAKKTRLRRAHPTDFQCAEI